MYEFPSKTLNRDALTTLEADKTIEVIKVMPSKSAFKFFIHYIIIIN